MLQEQGVRDLARDGAVHRHGAGQEAAAPRRRRRRRTAAATRRGRRTGSAERAGQARSDEAASAGAAHLPRRLLHRAHGSAVQPHRRLAARLSVLEPERSAEDVYDDTGWTFGELGNVQVVARHRRQGARRADGAGRAATCARRAASTGTGSIFLDQSQRRHRAGHAALSLQGRVVRSGRRAVRGRRARSSIAARSSSRTSPPAI